MSNSGPPMRKALVIRHVHFEDLGAFADPIEAAGYRIRYHEAGLDPWQGEAFAEADLTVVLGGPVGAYEDALYPFLADEREGLRRRLSAGRPTLGICLGAQLMASALGARVAPGPAKEIGWAPVALTEAGRAGPLRHLDNVPVLHWHGDGFACPAGAERLASTEICPNQAFALGSHALGFQFHPEADGRGFERWLIGHAVEIAGVPGLSVADLRADAQRLGPTASEAGRRCIAEWLAGLGR
ncbi:glutamine amidotransferase [Methylobacterium dankookense]|uniref:glutamine amidotransferase n=1 Tax=Methylobacterium dankookense TaxID=560405 RepID=UPI0027959EA9|nr:glutamine amidotransferase [Methylobacterium dankookense]